MSLRQWDDHGWLRPHKTSATVMIDFVKELRATIINGCHA